MIRLLLPFAAAILVASASMAFAEQESMASKAQEQAGNAVSSFIRRNHLFLWSQDQRCIRIVLGEEHRNYFDIEVRTNNSACGGDPNVSPMVTLFRVMKKNNSVRCFSDDLAEVVPCQKAGWFQRERKAALVSAKTPNPAVQGTLRDKAAQRP